LKKEAKAKNYFREKFTPKRSALKWTSNKMGNTKKGHNKTGRAVQTFCGQGGSSYAALFGAKNSGFFKIYGVSTRTGGLR